MKRILLSNLLVFFVGQVSFAQSNENCTSLFNSIANHGIHECINKEFEKLEIYFTDKTNGYTSLEKTGEYLKVAYVFKGDFDKRPSALQIFQNYSNAILKAGGEVLYKDDAKGLSGKLKKEGNLYWIKVSTDGSGFYWVETIKQGAMRQDVVLTANDIKKALNDEGRIAFYGIYFDSDKAIVKPGSAPVLKEIAAFLKTNPAISVFVVGHTDNTGDYKKNQVLSKDRAAAVLTELVSNYGVDKQQLAAEGVGSLAPVASNKSEEGRAKNRRVEIVLK